MKENEKVETLEEEKESAKMETSKEEKPKKEKKKENKEIEKLKQENEKLKQELENSNERLLRMNAELQNVKRHAQEDLERAYKYEGEELIKQLLTTVDNLERAILLDDDDLTDEVSKFLSGIKMVYSNLLTLLKNIGVEEIECMHKPFDAKTMEAVLTESIVEEEPNIVVEVLQKGYLYKDKVIRHAMVKVNE